MFRAVVCFCVVSAAAAILPFKLTDCNNSPNKLAHLENAQLSNIDPIHIPGNETVSIDLQILKPIDGLHYRVDLTILKKVLFGFVVVPCFEDPSKSVCSWELCTVLDGSRYSNKNHCPLEVAASSPDFDCACPFAAGTYHLNPTSFVIDDLPTYLKFLAQGDYKAHATITDTNTDEQVGCYDVQLSTGADCTGPLCVFG